MKRWRGMAKRIALLSAVILLLFGCSGGAWIILKPLPIVAAQVGSFPIAKGNVHLSWPSQGQAAIGAIGFGVVASKGSSVPQPIASIAKVITSLAVLDRQPLKKGQSGPTYTVTATDIDSYNRYAAEGGSTVKVVLGEKISQYQALQALLLPSANNMADSLAVWVFGSLGNYLTHANNMVARLGLKNTTLSTDASGLSPKTTSTASDLVLIGQAAMSNPVIAKIVAQDRAALPVAGMVLNTNWLLGQEGVVGLKTGNTEQAGGCFLGAAKLQLPSGRQIVIVSAVIGADSRNLAIAQSLELIKSAKLGFGVVTPIKAGQILGTYKLSWGGSVRAVASQDLSLAVWKGHDLVTTVSLNTVRRPLERKAIVGTVSAESGGNSQSIAVMLASPVNNPSLWWQIRHSL